MGPAHETRRHLPLYYYLMRCLQHTSRHGELRNFLEQSWKPASFDDGIVQITLFIFCTGFWTGIFTGLASVDFADVAEEADEETWRRWSGGEETW